MKAKKYILILIPSLVLFLVDASAQGRIYFGTRLGGVEKIDAPARFAPTGALLGIGYFAQLYAAPAASPVSEIRPYGSVEPFTDQRPGYIYGDEIVIPDIGPNSYALVVIRAFNGSSYEASNIRGESNAILVLLGNVGIGPGVLTGLQPFTVDYIPEPSVVAVVVMGCGVLWVQMRKR